MVNSTYDPITNTVATFVLNVRNASIYVIRPILALGINQRGTILYPIEHKTGGRKVENR